MAPVMAMQVSLCSLLSSALLVSNFTLHHAVAAYVIMGLTTIMHVQINTISLSAHFFLNASSADPEDSVSLVCYLIQLLLPNQLIES
jgi:phosphotransferase system IIA component